MSDAKNTSRRIVLGLEAQIPFHSRAIFKAFIEFVRSYGPTELIGMGDYLDCPAPARWNRGTAAEYGGNLQREIVTGVANLQWIRDVFDGPFSVHKGNHEERIDTYARTKAPAFADLDCLTVSNLLEYKNLDIRERAPIESLAPRTGWVTSHGHLGSLSRISGGTAMALSRRLGRSSVVGHTHRLGVLNSTVGPKTITGVETGHMMDVKKAHYIKTGCPDWQAGWVAIEITPQDNVSVTLVPVSPTGVVTFHEFR